MTSLASPIPWPPIVTNDLSAPGTFGFANVAALFDSATDRFGYVGHSPYTDSITDIYFRAGTVTSAPVVDVRVETVGTNGRPSGTLWATNTDKTVTIGASNTWNQATLTAAASLTRGQQFAINVVYSSGTANWNFLRAAANIGVGASNYPLSLQDTGAGTWTQLASPLVMFLKFSTGGIMYVPNLLPIDTGTSNGAFSSASSPNEIALRFQVPFACRFTGITFCSSNVSAAADFSCTLWPASSSTDADALSQVTVDGDSAGTTTQEGPFQVLMPTVALSANTTYYLGVRAQTANTLDIGELQSPSGIANSMNAFPIPSGGNVFKATRTWTAGTAGAWTNAANTLTLISPLIDQIDDGTGTGAINMSRIRTGM